MALRQGCKLGVDERKCSHLDDRIVALHKNDVQGVNDEWEIKIIKRASWIVFPVNCIMISVIKGGRRGKGTNDEKEEEKE